jgi:hypothetical protein
LIGKETLLAFCSKEKKRKKITIYVLSYILLDGRSRASFQEGIDQDYTLDFNLMNI